MNKKRFRILGVRTGEKYSVVEFKDKLIVWNLNRTSAQPGLVVKRVSLEIKGECSNFLYCRVNIVAGNIFLSKIISECYCCGIICIALF